MRRGISHSEAWPGRDAFEMGLDGGLCTHFMYGFATVTPGDGLSTTGFLQALRKPKDP